MASMSVWDGDELVTLKVRLTPVQKERLRTFCKLHGISMNALIRFFADSLRVAAVDLPLHAKIQNYADGIGRFFQGGHPTAVPIRPGESDCRCACGLPQSHHNGKSEVAWDREEGINANGHRRGGGFSLAGFLKRGGFGRQ